MNFKNLLISSIIFLLLLMPFVKADGGAFFIGRDFSSQALHGQHTQIAAINYENGKEKLVLAVKMDQIQNNSVVWIVPIPSDPNEVEINIFENFPRFMGMDVVKKAESDKRNFNNIGLFVSLSQLWTLPIIFSRTAFSGALGAGQGGVEVYAEVEKEGILTQVVTAETSQGLYNYLTDKGVSVSEVSIPVIDEYIGGDYCFIVSWLTGTGSSDKYRVPAVFVEFPTDKIFYPLKPTSLYGERGVPVLLYIIGFIEPEFYSEIKDHARYKYFYHYGGMPRSDWPQDFYDLTNGPFYYTRINIGYNPTLFVMGAYDQNLAVTTPPASNFVSDLWFEKLDKPPQEIEKSVFTINVTGFFISPIGLIIWMALTSFLTGIIAGVFAFRDSRILGFGLLGLANFFTIIGLIIATNKLMKGESKRKRTAFVILFSLIFVFVVNTALIWGVYSIL